MKEIQIDDYILKIGKNAKENDELISSSEKTYTWFHLSDYPSCHGVINCPLKDLTKKIIFIVACYIKNNTKYKNLKNLIVDYIELSNIKRTADLGKVLLIKKPNKIKV